MATFVEEVQSIADGNVAKFGQRLSTRIDALGEALDLLEEWTEASRDTQAELISKYDTAKELARDEIDGASGDSTAGGDEDSTAGADGEGAADLSAEELLDHPDVSEQTKRRLREYSTKLFVYLNEEDSYGEARNELLRQLRAELDLYQHLLPELQRGETSVADAQQRIARFAREETLGAANRTATDVLLDSAVEEDREE